MRKIIFLLTFVWTTLSNADTLTTGNLITNGNFETGNANGWTVTGDVQVLNDCCTLNNRTSNYDLEFGDSGSISQQFNLTSNSITTDMLDNGITLNSLIEVQNGECGLAGCWGGSGGADTFTNILTIKDSNGNNLAQVTQIRTDITDIYGQDFTDTLTYTGIGSYFGDINISGTDANAPATLGGANVDNISVTMTYDDSILPTHSETQLNSVNEELFKEFEKLDDDIEFKLEEEFETVSLKIYEEPKLETFQTEEEPKLEEEFKEEFIEPIAENEEKEAEKTLVMEENIPETEEKKEEEESLLQVEQSLDEEESKESQTLTEETQTAQSEDDSNDNSVDDKKTVSLEKSIKVIDVKVKNPIKNMQLKNIVKINAMLDNSMLLSYQVPFYEQRRIYEDQLDIQDNRILYTKNLGQYQQDDPIFIQQNQINNIRLQKEKLIREIEVLRNG